MSKKKHHGERNQTLSDILINGKTYYDWAVTTAFYSAIHFVEDSIFPVTINTQSCNDIISVRKAYRLSGRHEAREQLVIDKMDADAAIAYKWLDDKSRYSRYVTYKVTATEATKAQQYLNVIFSKCYPAPTTPTTPTTPVIKK
jgi:hypothetical protein